MGDQSHQFFDIVRKNIEFLLKEKEINRSTLAAKINLMPSTVTRLLKDSNKDVKLSTIAAIADFFEIKIADLLDKNFQLITKSKQNITMLCAPFLNWDFMRHYMKGQRINKPINNGVDDREWAFFESFDSINIESNIFALVSPPSLSPAIPENSTLIFDPNRQPKDGQLGLIRFKDTGDVALKALVLDPPTIWIKSIMTGDKSLLNVNNHEVIAALILTTYTKSIY
jgi:DNA-binding Xre family transcriptional regulator